MSHRVVIITGASRGIGAALARQLSGTDASLVLVARHERDLHAIARACGERAFLVVADVTRRGDVRHVVQTALDTFGHIDVMVNNAGRGISRAPSELTDEDIDEMMRVNVKSVLYGVQEVLPHFKTRGTGHVVNISSMLGRMPFATVRSAYCGAKHFVNALTAVLRDEVRQTHPGIQFSLVSPGVVYTDFGNNAVYGGTDSRNIPGGQTPEDVAAVIAGVIESRRPDVYTRAGARQRVAEYYESIGEDP
jgi:NADP-dependent 3-hydroxy acid dehydrogenase YdfG